MSCVSCEKGINGIFGVQGSCNPQLYNVTNTGDVFNEVMGALTIVDPFND